MNFVPFGGAFQPNVTSWRYAYNPLVGLTMARLVNMLNMAEMGYYADLQWLFRYVEKRDATYRAVKMRRLGAIKRLNWEVKVKNKFTTKTKSGEINATPQAAKQKEFLHGCYDDLDNLKQAIEHLALADFRGFAHVEKHYRNGQMEEGVFHLEPVPQWNMARRTPNPQWFYNQRAIMTNTGLPIDPQHFVSRECESAIGEIAAIAFLRKNMSQKDWDGFVETFGIPPLFVELPQGVGTTGPEFQALIETVMSDSRGVLPNGARIASVPDGQRGGRPFEEHIRYQDEQIVMAATGGLLTALTQATGMNEGQSGNHSDAFTDIAAGEAMMISEAFQKQFDIAELAREFPNQEPMVFFELAAQDIGEGERVIRDAQALHAAGYEIDTVQLEQRTGYQLDSTRDLDAQAAKEQQEQQAETDRKAQEQQSAQAEKPDYGPEWDGLDEITQNSIRSMAAKTKAALGASDAMLNRELEQVAELAGRFAHGGGVDAKRAVRYGDGLANRVRELVAASR